MFYCPQCGEDTETLDEGYCPECSQNNRDTLALHHAQYDRWNRMTDKQRDDEIRKASQ